MWNRDLFEILNAFKAADAMQLNKQRFIFCDHFCIHNIAIESKRYAVSFVFMARN